jgi:septal ring factor EnvC (AmiA/AmiB activator)
MSKLSRYISRELGKADAYGVGMIKISKITAQDILDELYKLADKETEVSDLATEIQVLEDRLEAQEEKTKRWQERFIKADVDVEKLTAQIEGMESNNVQCAFRKDTERQLEKLEKIVQESVGPLQEWIDRGENWHGQEKE